MWSTTAAIGIGFSYRDFLTVALVIVPINAIVAFTYAWCIAVWPRSRREREWPEIFRKHS